MTPIPTLFFVVILQILIFQFLAVRLTRVLPDQILGVEKLGREIGAYLENYRRKAGRTRYLIGAILLAIALVTTLFIPLEYGPKKLMLAGVSVASSLAMAVGITVDRRRFGKFVEELPEPPLRAASLRRRKIRDYYPTALETIPVLVFLGTIVGTVWLVGQGPLSGAAAITGLADVHAWFGPIVQIGLWALLSALTAASVAMPGCGAFAGRAYHDRPEEVVEQSERQRRRSIRFLYFAKLGVMLQLAVIQFHRLILGLGGVPDPWISTGRWVLLILLLLGFSTYLRLTTRSRAGLIREAKHES